MREIKFRVWNVRRFLKEDEVAILPNGKILFLVKDGESDAEYREMDFLDVRITFYTGLQDKNGIEAYEGDIIKAGNSIGVIFYNLDSFNIEWKVDRDFWNEHHRYHVPNGEVIGNIYESPHLLDKAI